MSPADVAALGTLRAEIESVDEALIRALSWQIMTLARPVQRGEEEKGGSPFLLPFPSG